MLTALALSLVLQAPAHNILTAEEKARGWQLLFDGTTTKGWRNFKSDKISEGWQVKDGTLTIADSSKAGDIITEGQYDWFELSIEANLGKGQNSGIMFRVLDKGQTPWQSGPEIQLYDHPRQEGQQVTGDLYELYRPSNDVDAAKPAGEWNHLRIILAPDKCETYVNGVKYYEYVYGSEEFWARVKKSKFSRYADFAKADKGHLAIQGDHGQVSFRNIKIRPIEAK